MDATHNGVSAWEQTRSARAGTDQEGMAAGARGAGAARRTKCQVAVHSRGRSRTVAARKTGSGNAAVGDSEKSK
jgi:hypothetical protein